MLSTHRSFVRRTKFISRRFDAVVLDMESVPERESPPNRVLNLPTRNEEGASMAIARFTTFAKAGSVALLLIAAVPSHAQLVDGSAVLPNIAGGQVNKSLDGQVGAGHGDVFTPGSAVYLIKRDPARSIRRGRQLFQRKFTLEQGMGPRVDASSGGDVMGNRALGAGLMDSCAGCHGRPRGAAGDGGDVVTRPDSRDAPHLFGLGLQEMLADEITADLRRIRDDAIRTARRYRTPVTRNLVSKGISYGRIRGLPNGTADARQVQGVNADLRVRPFFAEGGTISIREFAIGAFKAEMGLEAPDEVLCAATDPGRPRRVVSPSGFVYDPSRDAFERPPVCVTSRDGDRDGVVNELDTALIDHMEFYLLNYFKAGTGASNGRTRRGLQLMHSARCTSCHVQDLQVDRDRRVADVETVHDPVRGIFNRLFATASTRFEIVPDGDRFPQLLPLGEPFLVRNIFTDFKRHDLGPAFHEREYDGTLVKKFMTEPLWGVATTAPYGHDGRSINLEEVILRHGGEAQSSRNAFAALSLDDRRMVLEFLGTLLLFPPDDTASNLNPGVPGTTNPQDPAQHGSINLGALFQVPAEGAE
jgi:hypothetical protein